MKWLLLLALIPSFAGSARSASPMAGEEVSRRIEEANRLLDAHRYEEALAALQALEVIAEDLPNPGILYGNIGYCLAKSGRKCEAMVAFRKGLKLAESVEIRARLQTLIDQLKPEVDEDSAPCHEAPESPVVVVRPPEPRPISRADDPQVGPAPEIDVDAPREPDAHAHGRREDPPRPPPSSSGPLITAISGGVILVAGGATLAYAVGGSNDLDRAQASYRAATNPDDASRLRFALRDEETEARRAWMAGYVLSSVGVTLVATGLVWQLRSETSNEPSVHLGGGPNGLLLRGIW